jgi:hypothetical protein
VYTVVSFLFEPFFTSPDLIYDISAQEEQLQRCLAVL